MREPPAEELDGIAVCACTQEGGGTTWSEGAHRQKVWRDARETLDGGGAVSQGAGNVDGLDRAPAAVLSVVVVMHVDGLVRWSPC